MRVDQCNAMPIETGRDRDIEGRSMQCNAMPIETGREDDFVLNSIKAKNFTKLRTSLGLMPRTIGSRH